MIQLRITNEPAGTEVLAIIAAQKEELNYKSYAITKEEAKVIEKQKEAKRPLASIFRADNNIYVQFIDVTKERYLVLESARKAGSSLASEIRHYNTRQLTLASGIDDNEMLLAFAEGVFLGNYQFAKYKKEGNTSKLEQIRILSPSITDEELNSLQAVCEANLLARDLVNAPVSHLSAEDFSDEIRKLGKEAGFKVEVLNKTKIESLKMGGLLAVNAGSIDPPTFNILEWKPKNAVNTKPIILVGKGVVYDTGGLSIKSTPGSMDTMKSDMAGGAAVAGMLYALAKTKLPLYVVGLIPATDNRPGGRAVAPGDVITMHDGTTVEVLNTDAEGRLILADALSYAKKYEPELVLDFATLTGAAARAIGQYGTVFMGTAGEDIKNQLNESGKTTYERLVEFPMWDEYGEMVKSDIADLKNVSAGPSAGAITAGKFLEHFTDYPWLHFDIAGPSFLSSADTYRGKYATGVGVRLIMDFLKKRAGGNNAETKQVRKEKKKEKAVEFK